MADDIILNAGDSAGSTVKTDDDGTAHWQYVKVAFGADNTQTRVTASVGLPVILLTGTNAIGKLSANSGVDIGDVDVLTYPGPADAKFATLGQKAKAGSAPVTLASDEDPLNTIATNAGVFPVQEDGDALTSLQLIDNIVQVEDAAHGSGDSGVMALAVRNDALAALAGSDGDYAPLQVNAEGALYTHVPNTISTDNSTTSTLLADAVFTGPGEDISQHSSVSIIIDASHDSATDGMMFEFSSDNSNWDKTFAFTFTATNGARVFQFPVHAQFFRFRYINGDTNQTAFRVQTIYFHTAPAQTTHRLGDSVDPDRSVTAVKSAIIAQQAGTGDFIPIQATAGGNLKTSIEEIDGAIAGGGTEAAALRVTMANDSTGLLSVDNDGTFAVQEDGDALTALQLIDDPIFADDAPFTLTTSKVAMAGAIRADDLNGGLAAAEGDAVPLRVDANGALWVRAENTISTNNSSTSTLISDATFVGAGDDVKEYAAITVMLDASHDSAVDGMSFEFSTDNVNWDDVYPFSYVAANGARRFQFPVTARYFRVNYTNGGTGQTHFRVQTILHSQAVTSTVHRAVDDVDPDRHVSLTKTILMAQAAGSGDFVAIDATAGGNLKVAVEEFDTSLPAGSNLMGDVGISGARTSGGTTPYKNLDVDESEDEVKGTAGQVYWIHAINLTAGPLYLKFYNLTAANTTVGTSTPVLTLPVPANADSDGAGFMLSIPNGIEFDTAITIAGLTGVADSDTTGPGNNELIVNLGYA